MIEKKDKTRCVMKGLTEEESARKRGRQGPEKSTAGATGLLALYFSMELCYILSSSDLSAAWWVPSCLHLLHLFKHPLQLHSFH